MGWNRPTNITSNNRTNCKKKKNLLTSLLIVTFVLACVAILWFSIFKNQDGDIAEVKTVNKIKLANTNLPVKAKIETKNEIQVKKQYKEMSNEEKLAYWHERYGDNPPENIKQIVYYLKNPPQRQFKAAPSIYSIFKHPSERSIASLLKVEPGRWIMRPQVFGESFDDDFIASMKEKIEITSEDSEEQRAFKQAVIDTKNELIERLKKGEKPSEVMTECSRQLYELGQYRSNLQREIAKARGDADKSDDDVIDLVNAANKLLKEKGLREFTMPSMFAKHRMLKNATGRTIKEKK